MIATFAFVCLFAAVSCPPPPPPPPPPSQSAYGQISNYRVVGYRDPRIKRNRPPAASPAPSIARQLFHPRPAAAYKPPTANSYKPAVPKNIYAHAPDTYKRPTYTPPVANNIYPQPPAAYKPPAAVSYTPPVANNIYPQLPVAYKPPAAVSYIPPVANNIYPQPPAVYQPPVSSNPKPPAVQKLPTAHIPRQPVVSNPYHTAAAPVAGNPYQPPGPGNCQHCRFERPEQRCGSDNVTYENDCYMKCAHFGRMEKQCDGQCPCYYQHPPNSGCYCFRDYDPVCAIMPGPGRQMKTMASRCEALCEKMQVMNGEECWSNRY